MLDVHCQNRIVLYGRRETLHCTGGIMDEYDACIKKFPQSHTELSSRDARDGKSREKLQNHPSPYWRESCHTRKILCYTFSLLTSLVKRLFERCQTTCLVDGLAEGQEAIGPRFDRIGVVHARKARIGAPQGSLGPLAEHLGLVGVRTTRNCGVEACGHLSVLKPVDHLRHEVRLGRVGAGLE